MAALPSVFWYALLNYMFTVDLHILDNRYRLMLVKVNIKNRASFCNICLTKMLLHDEEWFFLLARAYSQYTHALPISGSCIMSSLEYSPPLF
ncbi:hypothetical protein VNO77_36664 [Canavalia gladiata]|uniref:Uncharacterized protein n=1 Tax=Canavalia gladiata TaxID=3824 RepID=A0AAN9K836_CANGL